MRKVSRRSALTGLTGAGIATLFANSAAFATVSNAKVEFFVIGPFLLGEFFSKSMLTHKSISPVEIGADPGEQNLITALNQCQVFLIDARDASDPKELKFAHMKDFPLAVAAGKFAYDWNDMKKKFSSRLVKLTAARGTTDYSKPVPTRDVTIEVRVEMRGETEFQSASCVSSTFSQPAIVYDLNGKKLQG